MLRRICRVLSVVACLAGAAWSQETRGTIRGRVADASGGVIANAEVQIVNQAMGTMISMRTGQDGSYTAPLLLPGTYQVSITAPGFKKFIRDGIQLQVADRLEVNAALEVGASQQTVTVTGTPELLSTETASMGSVVNSQQIRDLPLAYGNPFALIAISSGTAFTGNARLNRPFEPTHIVAYSINGTRGNRSDVTLDGAPATATANAGEVISTYVPPTDLLSEFKVQTAIFDAAVGNTEGGVTNLSTKSGTNQVHGTLYYELTRKDMWANDFFNNTLGNPRPDFRFNRWGASLGGPVYIPKLYDGLESESVPVLDAARSLPEQRRSVGDQRYSDTRIHDAAVQRASFECVQSPPFPGSRFESRRTNNIRGYYRLRAGELSARYPACVETDVLILRSGMPDLYVGARHASPFHACYDGDNSRFREDRFYEAVHV